MADLSLPPRWLLASTVDAGACTDRSLLSPSRFGDSDRRLLCLSCVLQLLLERRARV